MARAKAHRRHRTTTFAGWRQALVLLLVSLFAVQTYVVQTHIHIGSAAGHAARLGQQDRHDPFPGNDDPANCPLCQEILHTGPFVTPSAIALLPPAFAISTIQLVDTALPHIFAPSHDWRGRAPPQI